MRDLTFARFDSARDNRAKPETRPWEGAEGWLAIFSKHTVRGSPEDATDKARLDAAKNGPALVLGAIAEGGKHTNDAVERVEALGLDIEEASEEKIGAALAALEPWEFIAYTTHKHGAPAANANPALRTRLRVILPLARPLQASEHAKAWAALNELTGDVADRKTKNVGRLYFLPSTYDPAVAWTHRNEGKWLEPESLYAAIERSAPSLDEKPGDLSDERSRFSYAIRQALRHMPVGELADDGTSLKELAQRALKGEPLAEPGARHNAVLAITMWVAQRLKGRASTEAIVAVFGPSIRATLEADPSAPGESDLVSAWEGAALKVRAWLQEAAESKRAAAEREQLDRAGPGTEKYTDEELAQIAEIAGVPSAPGAAAQALRRRWIIQAGDQAYYLLAGDGGYRGPFGASMGRTAAVELLARAPVLLNEPTPRGSRRRALQELAEDYGAAAANIVVDLTAQITRFNERRRTIYEAARPLRTDLVPEYDEQIATWLRILARDNYDKLCDWMACAPDLTKLLCALYISGGPAAGKTIFAMGMARLWSEAPAQFEQVMGSFNDELLRCPLILADEDFGQARWRRQDLTGQIRSMISTLERTVTRKYLPPAALRGAIRLVIAANNDYLLSSREALNNQDVTAIAQRFLYIKAPNESADFMRQLPIETKARWKQEGIARHALWLQANRRVAPGQRFWVEGDITQMHRLVTISSDWTSRACEWLVRFLMNPKPFAQRNDGLVRVGNGKLLVNEQALIDGWRLYFPDTKIEPETSKLGAALRAITTNDRILLRWQGERKRYREIVLDTIFAWSDVHGIGNRQAMLRTLWDGSPPREPGDDDDAADKTTDDLATVIAENSPEIPI